MAPANQKAPPKKRIRKRKRRAASSSSSSSDSDSDSSSSSGPSAPVVRLKAPPKPQVAEAPESSDSDSSSSSDDSETASSRAASPVPAAVRPDASTAPTQRRERSPSPPPAATSIPNFLSPEEPSQSDAVLRARFKKFWMASVADGFKSDLEEIRKEPAMTKSRLAILIDSLASGADVFASSSKNAASSDRDINEMEVVLGNE